MSRFNTGNPIDSSDFKDLSDNAKNMDIAVNSSADTFQDRMGKSRLTWTGIVKAGSGDPSIAVDAAARAELAASSVEQNAEQIAQDAAQQAVADVIAGVDGSVQQAVDAADRAESAAVAAYSSGNQFDSATAGLAATVDGQYFLVRTADPQVFNVYLNDGGNATASGQFSVPTNVADKFSPVLSLITSGSGSSQTVSIPGYSAYRGGEIFWWVPNATSNGPMTLNINGLGPLPVEFLRGTPVRGGEVRSGYSYLIRISAAGGGLAQILTSGWATRSPSPLMTLRSTGGRIAQTATLSDYSEYRIEDTFLWSPSATNSGTITLDVNSLGGVPVVKGDGGELEPGDVVAGRLCLIRLSGTTGDMVFRVIGTLPSDSASEDGVAQSLQVSNPNLFTADQVAGLDKGDADSGIVSDVHEGVPCWSVTGSLQRWGLFARSSISGGTLSAAVRILDWQDSKFVLRFLIVQYSSPSSQTGEIIRQEVSVAPQEFTPGFLRISNMPIHEDCQSIGFFIGGGDGNGTVKHRDMLLCSGGDATFRVSAPAGATGSVREVWVSPDGSDSGSGSSSLPFATLARAVSAIDGRGTIYLAAGDYGSQRMSVYNVADIKLVGGADSEFKRSLFRYGTRLPLKPVPGRPGIYSSPLSRTPAWLWVDSIPDEQTLVPYGEQHSLLDGRSHRLWSTRIWHIPADNLTDALDLIGGSATPVCWRDATTSTVYLSLPDGADGVDSDVRSALDNTGLFSNARGVWNPQGHFEATGLDIRYGSCDLKSFRTSRAFDVKVLGAAVNGFNIGNWSEIDQCEAAGCGSGDELGDGFNAHNHAIWTYRDCYGHDNWDDGESSHQNCKVTGWGNIMEYNGGSGFTPALGAQEILHNCLSRKNATSSFRTGGKMGGFQVTGDPTPTDPGVITSLEAYNCVSIGDRNGFHDGTTSVAPAQRRLLAVNCKVFDAEETAFACSEIRDCSESGSGQDKGSGTIVANSTLVT